MSDPARLRTQGGLGAALLGAAESDAPSPGSRARAAAALGIASGGVVLASTTAAQAASAGASAASGGAVGGAGAGGTAGAAVAVKAGGAALATKIAGGSLVALALTGGAFYGMRGQAPPPLPAEHATSAPAASLGAKYEVSTAGTLGLPRARSGESPAEPSPLPAEAPSLETRRAAPKPPSTPVPREARADEAAAAPAPVAPSAAHESAAPPTLGRELALLDDASAALRRGDTDRAMRLLDEHDRDAPGGALAIEASVLRVDVLVARGDVDGAKALARTILARDGKGPHARRLRALVDAP